MLDKKINRDKFFNSMRQKNIGVNIHYIPVYKFSYYKRHFSFNVNDFPVTEDIYSRIITLPLFSKITDEDVKSVVNAVKESLRGAR